MLKCMKICGAFTYRASRRRTTLLLIVAFVLILTVIFQFYAYKQHDYTHAHSRIGDFDYKPGSFLRGRQPNENKSYCEFHYGLPYSFKLEDAVISTSPEFGDLSNYRVIYNVVTETAYANVSKYNAVTYATQATPEFMYHIIEIARHWDGPISLSVFVPDYDLDIAMQIMDTMCRCYEHMSKVSMHLFYPKKYPPKLNNHTEVYEVSTPSNINAVPSVRRNPERYKQLNGSKLADYIRQVREAKIKRMESVLKRRHVAPRLKFEDCSGPMNFLTFRKDHNITYPINVGRNVARNASRTNYFLVSDIELVPSEGLAPKFLTMVRRLMGDKKREEGCIFSKTIFVVPLFEVERGEEIPRDKDTLIRLVNSNRATYFHQKTCPHCHRFPGMQSWLSRSSPPGIEPMVIGRREYPYHRWEPLYFGTQKEPWYSEMLSWEGRQDKMTQMLELCLQEYRMVVIDGGFLCHAASTVKSSRHNGAERINARKYFRIARELKSRYRDNPRCKISHMAIKPAVGNKVIRDVKLLRKNAMIND